MQWQEAEVAYRTAVAECNDCQYQVHVAAQVGHNNVVVYVSTLYLFYPVYQRSILCAYRRMVIDVDIQLKSVS